MHSLDVFRAHRVEHIEVKVKKKLHVQFSWDVAISSCRENVISKEGIEQLWLKLIAKDIIVLQDRERRLSQDVDDIEKYVK